MDDGWAMYGVWCTTDDIERMYGFIDGWMGVWMDVWMGVLTYDWMDDGWMD